jgi:hypothetical protein
MSLTTPHSMLPFSLEVSVSAIIFGQAQLLPTQMQCKQFEIWQHLENPYWEFVTVSKS